MMQKTPQRSPFKNSLLFIIKHYKGIAICILLTLLIAQMYKFREQNESLRDEARLKTASLEAIEQENKKITSDIEYLKNPYNVLKEIKSQFNYRRPNEKLIVIIPDKKPEPEPNATSLEGLTESQ